MGWAMEINWPWYFFGALVGFGCGYFVGDKMANKKQERHQPQGGPKFCSHCGERLEAKE